MPWLAEEVDGTDVTDDAYHVQFRTLLCVPYELWVCCGTGIRS